MAILQRSCCGCCSVRTGCIVIANIWMIMQFAGIGSAVRNIVGADGAVATTDIVSVSIYSVGVIIDILLIYGVKKEMKELVLSWVIFSIACTLASLGVTVYLTIVTLGILGAVEDDWSDLVMAIVMPVLAGAWIIWGIVFLITVYGCLVVYSHYQNLRDGVVEGVQQGMVMSVQPPPVDQAPGTAVQSW
ncbi:Hypp5867 [Branchiostoma lanceolatum]|uniref:Hypp5867 protein n=1 Tax=Branchiostoma lanceolatum TaxID=7740 RepID=A0A8J9VS37_BRALA|nr:Hypp5867 [Branchiostoma lanceolatum]